MPRIGRGTPTSSPSPEHAAHATPPRTPETGGGNAAGRRERPGLLGFLTRPFRGSTSSTRSSGNAGASASTEREQAPGSRAAPRTAGALLRRTPALARGHGEEVMARIAQAPAQTPGRMQDGAPSRSPARGALAPQPGRRHAPETQAAAIVRELRDAGLDLSDVRANVAAQINGDPVGLDVRAVRILGAHFPRMAELGLAGDTQLAAALHRTLSQSAPVAPRARLAPAETRPRPTGGAVRNAQPRLRAEGPPPEAPGRRGRGANTSLMGRLAGSGVDMGRVAAAIDDTMRNGRQLPEDIRGALRRAGIETHIGAGQVPMDHPLVQLRREIHLAMPEEREPSPPREQRMPRATRRPRLGIPPISSRPRAPDANAAGAATALPRLVRAQGETNAQYAWRLHYQNPEAPIAHIAADAVGAGGHFGLRQTIRSRNAEGRLPGTSDNRTPISTKRSSSPAHSPDSARSHAPHRRVARTAGQGNGACAR